MNFTCMQTTMIWSKRWQKILMPTGSQFIMRIIINVNELKSVALRNTDTSLSVSDDYLGCHRCFSCGLPRPNYLMSYI